MIAGIFRWMANFFPSSQSAKINLKRRSVIAAGVAGLGGGLLLKARPSAAKSELNPAFVRPPGALLEEEFLNKCIRCGECMKACPTNAIQPAMFEAGLQAMWSPLLKLRLGYCEYKCNQCGQVCPTGAIGKLPLAQKQKTKIGLSVVDKNRCLPYAFGEQCQMCYDQCPLPDKAISLVAATVVFGSKTIVLKQPQVDSKLCIGCGICENKCPVAGKAAIRVESV